MSPAAEINGQRYRILSHAVQTAVAIDMQQPGSTAASPKHLRTGLDIIMRDHASLVHLLISKGVITEDEYTQAIADGMAEEVSFQESILSEKYGKSIKLA